MVLPTDLPKTRVTFTPGDKVDQLLREFDEDVSTDSFELKVKTTNTQGKEEVFARYDNELTVGAQTVKLSLSEPKSNRFNSDQKYVGVLRRDDGTETTRVLWVLFNLVDYYRL
jgi:hypothetical protein